MDFKKEAEALKDHMVSFRRHFHQYPEPSGQEFRTAEIIADALTGFGLEVRSDVGSPLPGVVGLLRGGNPGPTIALRADMDALRVSEQRESAYQSRISGLSHGAGRDGIMAIQLGAAELLNRHKSQLHGNVKFIFQPSQEIYGGAIPMIQDDVLKNPDVSAIIGLRVDSAIRVGQAAVSFGPTAAASDRLILQLRGSSAHGAYPHEGVDAMVLASHVILGIQTLLSREKDAFNPAVLTFGIIEGGSQPNVLCDEVRLRGILRSLNPETRGFLLRRLTELLDGLTKAYRGSYQLTHEKSYDRLDNHPDIALLERRAAEEILGAENVLELAHAQMITEDFSYFAQEVPGALWFLGTGNPTKDTDRPRHRPDFDIDEDALPLGAAIQARLAFDFLQPAHTQLKK